MDKIYADSLNDIERNNNSGRFDRDITFHMKIEKVEPNTIFVLTGSQIIMTLIFSGAS